VSGGQDVQSGISVNPAVFEFTAEHVGSMFGQFYGIHGDPVGWGEGFQQGLLDAFLTGRPLHAGPVPILPGPAQQAVADALLTAVGSQPLSPSVTSAGVSAAAQRFAALSASARHAWLAAHLAALRAGTITLAGAPPGRPVCGLAYERTARPRGSCRGWLVRGARQLELESRMPPRSPCAPMGRSLLWLQ